MDAQINIKKFNLLIQLRYHITLYKYKKWANIPVRGHQRLHKKHRGQERPGPTHHDQGKSASHPRRWILRW